ncbi:transcriptional regulator, partial [Enterococcus faecium]
LTRSKKLPTAVLDTYIRETMLWQYRPRRLKNKEEKAVGNQNYHINNEWFFFVGKIEVYERDRLLEHQQKMLGHSLTQLLAKLQETAVQQLPRKRAEDSELSYLMI